MSDITVNSVIYEVLVDIKKDLIIINDETPSEISSILKGFTYAREYTSDTLEDTYILSLKYLVLRKGKTNLHDVFGSIEYNGPAYSCYEIKHMTEAERKEFQASFQRELYVTLTNFIQDAEEALKEYLEASLIGQLPDGAEYVFGHFVLPLDVNAKPMAEIKNSPITVKIYNPNHKNDDLVYWMARSIAKYACGDATNIDPNDIDY